MRYHFKSTYGCTYFGEYIVKINKLTLKNFKFFYGEETLDFEGKNVLLYGKRCWACVGVGAFVYISMIQRYSSIKYHQNYLLP